MMIHAYQECYLNSAKRNIGIAFDYAINVCKISGADFVNMFLISNISKRIENGEPLYLKGKSGIEIAKEIIEQSTGKEIEYKEIINYEKSKEYWIGYAITYYQWYSNKKFRLIFNAISYYDLEKMYFTLHEADISKLVEILNDIFKKKYPDTNLKRIRMEANLTQTELAKRSGVSLRSIQMYEQKNKDINKANVTSLYMLSKVLNCNIEDLIEK
ncbi:MAG: helix-turn-helix transcriptional regulator [Acholeplasmatales bacterium]|nr:helix-turn-helix transcriptional regulator [Acholeplasmatales bacterium]